VWLKKRNIHMSPRRPGGGKTRFTLWLPAETIKELEKLQRTTSKGSVSEVVREAIDVYMSLREARDQGIDLYYEDRKKGEKGRIWLLPGEPPI
jgi:hypothetical protein